MTLPIGAVGEALAHTSLAGIGQLEPQNAGAVAGGGASAHPSGALTLATSPTAGAAGGPSVGVASGVGEVQGVSAAGATAGLEGAAGAERATGGFGEALTQAISSLEQSQQSADGAAQSLATGTAANPESAVVTVEDAQLAMQLASQIRNKAVEGVQQLFQIQM
jgi:flagellar hook-basal body complex protein FliE